MNYFSCERIRNRFTVATTSLRRKMYNLLNRKGKLCSGKLGLGPPTWDLLRLNLRLKLTNSASPEISQIWCATNLNLTQLTWDFIWVEIWDFSPLPSRLFSMIFTLLIPQKQVNAFKLDTSLFLWQFSLKLSKKNMTDQLSLTLLIHSVSDL